MGVLSVATDMRINLVNAQAMAQERGIRIVEEKDPEGGEQYLNLVGVEVRSTAGTVYTAGTSVHGTVHLNRLNDFTLDMEPSAPYMLFTTHTDQPGMIGKVGHDSGRARREHLLHGGGARGPARRSHDDRGVRRPRDGRDAQGHPSDRGDDERAARDVRDLRAGAATPAGDVGGAWFFVDAWAGGG